MKPLYFRVVFLLLLLISVSPAAENRRIPYLLRMQEVMGPFRKPDCPLNLKVLEETDCGDYVRQKIEYQSEPGQQAPAFLLKPKKLKSPVFGILCLHQTHPAGNRVVVGLGNSPNDEYAVELVKRGFVCLAPPYPLLADYHPPIKDLGYKSGTMKAIIDNIRGLDLLESLPEVKKGMFGAIGHSLGGHNSLFTAAFDERIKVVVTSCGFDSFKDYMDGIIQGWTSDRYMPGLRGLKEFPFDFPDVLCAISPRAVFINAPLEDKNFKWKSVDRVIAVSRKNCSGTQITLEHPAVGHTFPTDTRERAYQFIQKTLTH